MKILITAGPTWIKIDEVRILTSIFTGGSGIFLAQEFKKRGHRVTLIVNAHCLVKVSGLRVVAFRYFDEFKKAVIAELRRGDYDAVIHSAAVSDYRLEKPFRGKISSGKAAVSLRLIPTQKLISMMRVVAQKTILVQFKLELKRSGLIEKAYRSLIKNGSDFVVANALEDLQRGYRAFLIDKNKNIVSLDSKKALFTNLLRVIRKVKH
jgi:phosphopantothenoylcysteine decarboxylase/phosphopantothenate--cysteine ligase